MFFGPRGEGRVDYDPRDVDQGQPPSHRLTFTAERGTNYYNTQHQRGYGSAMRGRHFPSQGAHHSERSNGPRPYRGAAHEPRQGDRMDAPGGVDRAVSSRNYGGGMGYGARDEFEQSRRDLRGPHGGPNHFAAPGTSFRPHDGAFRQGFDLSRIGRDFERQEMHGGARGRFEDPRFFDERSMSGPSANGPALRALDDGVRRASPRDLDPPPYADNHSDEFSYRDGPPLPPPPPPARGFGGGGPGAHGRGVRDAAAGGGFAGPPSPARDRAAGHLRQFGAAAGNYPYDDRPRFACDDRVPYGAYDDRPHDRRGGGDIYGYGGSNNGQLMGRYGGHKLGGRGDDYGSRPHEPPRGHRASAQHAQGHPMERASGRFGMHTRGGATARGAGGAARGYNRLPPHARAGGRAAPNRNAAVGSNVTRPPRAQAEANASPLKSNGGSLSKRKAPEQDAQNGDGAQQSKAPRKRARSKSPSQERAVPDSDSEPKEQDASDDDDTQSDGESELAAPPPPKKKTKTMKRNERRRKMLKRLKAQQAKVMRQKREREKRRRERKKRRGAAQGAVTESTSD